MVRNPTLPPALYLLITTSISRAAHQPLAKVTPALSRACLPGRPHPAAIWAPMSPTPPAAKATAMLPAINVYPLTIMVALQGAAFFQLPRYLLAPANFSPVLYPSFRSSNNLHDQKTPRFICLVDHRDHRRTRAAIHLRQKDPCPRRRRLRLYGHRRGEQPSLRLPWHRF